MKILVLSNLYPPHAIGGYEERCRQIIDRLRARGHDIRVLTSTHGVEGEQTEGHVHRRLRVHGFFGHPWLPIQRLYALEKHNQAVLREELASFQPDVVHVWNLGGISKALTLALQQCGRPVVYDVSDHWIARSLKADVWLRWWNGDSGGAAAGVLRALLKLSGLASAIKANAPFAPWPEIEFRRIYFCSEALKQITIAKGYDLQHARVIYCGIETEKFQLRSDSERFTRLLYVGRLSEDKDPLVAIRAMKRLPSHFSLSLYGRGDEDYMNQLRDEARELGTRVEFKTASAGEMAQVYSQYDALLFTSAWEEPFALTPLEAMAARLPVVGTLEGGSRELIRHGENALAFRTGNAEDLATQILRMEAEPTLRRAMAETAFCEVRERYDIEEITTQIETTLNQSLKA
ncbi:MAG: glycosyltransferase family 4 protein [Verrucomicrobiota bacterium]